MVKGGSPPSPKLWRASCEARRAKQDGAGWLNQTAASALRGARSVTELNQQKANAFSKAGDRPKMTTRHRADLSIWSASKRQAESGDFRVSNPRGPLLWSLHSACFGRGWTFADLVELAPETGLGISEETFADARHRARQRLRLQSPCGGGEFDMCYLAHGLSSSLGGGP